MSHIIILGDPHLGKNQSLGKSGVGSTLNSRIEDQIKLLDWTLEQADLLLANHIIITGDVFDDPKPASYIITAFISWLKKCSLYNINVHIIIGNHDILRSGFIYTSPLDIIDEVELDNVFIHKDVSTVFIDTTAFTFVPFRDRKSLGVNTISESLDILQNIFLYELSLIPQHYTKILIGHQAIEGSIFIGDEANDLANEIFCPISLFNGYDYVWMGHVHKPQVLNDKSPHVAHVGSMDISNFGESESYKHLLLLNLEDTNNIWQTHKIPTRFLKKISINVPDGIEDSTEYVLQELNKCKNLKNSTVRVEVNLLSPDVKSLNQNMVQKYLIDAGVFNISGILESKKTSIIKKDVNNTLDTKMDVVSAIKKYADHYLDSDKRSDFISLANEIYTTFKSEIR
jgi:DNA repair exonuclease SbcCD nuclease subunit